MAVTRINNNQITDASAGNIYVGINADTKLQNYSITSTKLANSLTYGSDLTITGNLTVDGTTTSINTINTLIEDPLLVLADGQTTGTPTVDIGTIGLRGSEDSAVLAWKESQLGFVTALSNTTISNTTFNISSYANLATGNFTVNGTTSLVGNVIGAANFTDNVTGGNLLTPGQVSATGTVTGGNVDTTGTVSATGTITAGNVDTGGNVSATGNITGDYFIGNGSQLSGVTATNVDANNLTGNTLASGVTFSSLTTVGALTTLSVVGTATVGNLDTGGTVSATGTVTGGNVSTAGTVSAIGNVTGGNLLSNGDISAAGSLTIAGGSGGNISGANVISATTINASGNISATGNITGNYFFGNGSQLTDVTATSVDANNLTGNTLAAGVVNSSLTSVGDLITLSVVGTATAGNVDTGGNVSATGTVTAGNVSTAGQVSAQGNVYGGNVVTDFVTSIGNTTITISGGEIVLNPVGNVGMSTRSITNLADPVAPQEAATKFYVDSVAQGLDIKQSVHVATGNALPAYIYNNGNVGVGATLTATSVGNLVIDGDLILSDQRVLIKDEVSGNAPYNGIYLCTTQGDAGTAYVLTRAVDFDLPAEMYSAFVFVETGNVYADTGWTCTNNSSSPITIGTTSIAWSQFSGAGQYTAGEGLSLTGTQFNVLYDNNTIGIDGSNQVYIPANATLTTPNIGDATGTSLSVTGTVTAGNIATAGTVSATGTATAGNIVTGGTLSATGTITAGNVDTGGNVSATGNITGDYFIGNGSQLSGVTATNVDANNLTGNTLASGVTFSSLTTVGILTSASVSGTVTAGNVDTGGTVSATGTVTGSSVSAIGNVTGGNLLSNGNISAVGNLTIGGGSGGNISGANVIFATTLSATGNLISGNVNTAGNISATGNITGNYFFGNGSQMTGIITTVDANDLTGNTLSANVVNSSLTSVGALTTLSVVGTATVGNLSTGGTVSATGTVTGGNVDTTGTVTGLTIVGNTAVFGTSNSAVTGSTVTINATDSILVPVGNTIQRPSGVTGQFRFNSTNNNLEVYNNSQWSPVGAPAYTIVTDEQFNGDGNTVAYTLSANATTASTIVSINGVLQIPTTAYSISSTTLTFTEAPDPGDLIDVRALTTTAQVISIANSPGNAIVAVSPTSAQVNITGNLVTTVSNSAPTLSANGTFSFQLVSNTQLNILVRGSDGTTRTANLTLS